MPDVCCDTGPGVAAGNLSREDVREDTRPTNAVIHAVSDATAQQAVHLEADVRDSDVLGCESVESIEL
jgi:hypothetical protein